MLASSNFSNQTLYGIKSDAVRYSWAGFFIFVALSSLIGDTTILIASIKYRAFNLHKCIVIIIQHIAICDLMATIIHVIPKTILLFSYGWILGDFLCSTLPYSECFCYPTGTLLISIMTSTKLLMITFPLRARAWSSNKAHFICAAAWITVSIVPLLFIVLNKNGTSFDLRIYECGFNFSTNQWLFPLLSTVYLVIPNCIVLFTTVNLLIIARKIARRGRENLRWEGIITTVLTASVYCISVLPYAIYRIADQNIKSLQDPQGYFQNEYYMIATSFLNLNTISNFYIYCLTVSSFREFLWSRIKLFRITSINYGKSYVLVLLSIITICMNRSFFEIIIYVLYIPVIVI